MPRDFYIEKARNSATRVLPQRSLRQHWRERGWELVQIRSVALPRLIFKSIRFQETKAVQTKSRFNDRNLTPYKCVWVLNILFLYLEFHFYHLPVLSMQFLQMFLFSALQLSAYKIILLTSLHFFFINKTYAVAT